MTFIKQPLKPFTQYTILWTGFFKYQPGYIYGDNVAHDINYSSARGCCDIGLPIGAHFINMDWL